MFNRKKLVLALTLVAAPAAAQSYLPSPAPTPTFIPVTPPPSQRIGGFWDNQPQVYIEVPPPPPPIPQTDGFGNPMPRYLPTPPSLSYGSPY
jgi:hypothetical protein